MSKIEIKQLTFAYDNQATPLFDQVNLNLDTHWKLGLIGRNGRGKTTLLKLLQQQLEYQGEVVHQLSFVYFPQIIKDEKQLTLYALEAVADFEQWQLERELRLLKVAPDILWREYATLSGGEKTKVLLALLFIEEKAFPLIDEPTNHLDIAGRQQVAEYLKKKKSGFILVSHDRSFVDEVVDHILTIERRQIQLYQGNYSVYETQKQLQDEYELAENEKIKKEVSRLQETARKKAQWSMSREKDKYGSPKEKGSGAIGDTGAIGARAARVMKRSKFIQQRAELQAAEKEKLLKNLEITDPLTMEYQPSHHKTLLTVENLRLSFNQQPLFQPITFSLKVGERVGITGINGSGKTSFLNYLLHNFTGKSQGSAQLAHQIQISYIRQNYEDNRGTLQEFALENRLNYSEFLNNLKKLGMERTVFNNRIEHMSMGQRKKVEVAKSLSQTAELYIWDEPLNYLDVFNHQQLEQLILTVQPALLVIEHDAHFIEKVTSKKIQLAP
jgi:lincosamide and streptogramin A transport system ATP-binding/permease protein